jgi:hypothetical protein
METPAGEYADLPPGIGFWSRRVRLSSTPKRRYGSCASGSVSTTTPR